MIETENLKLIPCELAHFEAILNNPKQLEQMLDVSLVDEWISFPEAMPYGYEYLKTNPDALGWWTYFFVHRKDKTLIGFGGYKGKADDAGVVEIGYGIAPAYRNRGLATEAAQGLVDYAFAQPHVKAVDAHTLAEVNSSTKVLEKIGLKNIESLTDPNDGEVWHWRLEHKK